MNGVNSSLCKWHWLALYFPIDPPDWWAMRSRCERDVVIGRRSEVCDGDVRWLASFASSDAVVLQCRAIEPGFVCQCVSVFVHAPHQTTPCLPFIKLQLCLHGNSLKARLKGTKIATLLRPSSLFFGPDLCRCIIRPWIQCKWLVMSSLSGGLWFNWRHAGAKWASVSRQWHEKCKMYKSTRMSQ